LTLAVTGCFDRAPLDYGRTRSGPGATVRYDLGHKPLPEIPLPNDTATWPDLTSRTGVRINASLVAPTEIERQARQRFSQMEGWGTFAPITVAFDVPAADPEYSSYEGAAVDIANVRARHQGDDYDLSDDAVYLVDLTSGVPVILDVGAGNYSYTLRQLDKYWANDTRRSERNLLFETIDETQNGAIDSYAPEHDTDFDGVLDRPNLAEPDACPAPDLARCDNAAHPDYPSDECFATRRARDRCITDELLTWYERETDTFILRPLLPMHEMRRYAVVLTDRLVDGRGNPVKSPFDHIFHAAQRDAAERVEAILNDPALASYYGDLHGTGIGRVGFVWSFTTQPTVDDLRRLRDGLYGQGPFGRWAEQYPPQAELQRTVGLTGGLAEGNTEEPGWENTPLGQAAGCPEKMGNLWLLRYEDMRTTMKQLVEEGFELDPGPDAQQLLSKFDNVSHMVIGTFRSPFLLEGGPKSTDPNSAFHINYVTGEAVETEDVVQFWLIVPKETDKHKQPFNVNIFGHGYTSTFLEQILYAGNMAEHGVATIGINAMGHGLVLGIGETTAATALLGGICHAPAFDALTLGRTRDLNRDGVQDSGGDFWSSYIFHTRDGVRQSILDHIQLVRVMRAWGTAAGVDKCRNDASAQKVGACPWSLGGDFDGNGVVDAGGTTAQYGTWGESLGGILSGIHGAIDAYVGSAVPGSGGGGLTDVGIRSFQGGVVEAVLLRIWGPLLVSVPSEERKPCEPTSVDEDRCTSCAPGQISLRWVIPDVNGTGELEINCLEPADLVDTTVFVLNLDNGERKCARVDAEFRFRIGLPASDGDRVAVRIFQGRDNVTSYDSCQPLADTPLRTIETWGPGRFVQGSSNIIGSATCEYPTCASFQGRFFGEGTPLTSPTDGFGLLRQTPSSRRFFTLAQAALEPGDPISFAPYYALRPMTDPFGNTIAPHAVFTLNTIGDQNVPLSSGIAFARATGALPFLRPDQGEAFPAYVDFVTPQSLYDELGGKTPNQALIEGHVVEGITKLARHPAAMTCVGSSNFDPAGSTYVDAEGVTQACFLTGCTEMTESSGDTRVCRGDLHCDFATQTCVPNGLTAERCSEALFDADELDEGKHKYFEQAAAVPQRLARLTASARNMPLVQVWAPRLLGKPFGPDKGAYSPQPAPEGRLTALLNAYLVPEGDHTFVHGNPCQAFDHGTYLTNLVARFFESDGTDIYYLSHPESHHCLETAALSCDYAK
jgi:hypothetical protein